MGKIGWLFGGIFAPIGLLFAGIGLWLYASDQDLAANGERVSGTVIDIVSYRDSDGDTMYRPVVEFVDAKGIRQEFSSDVSSSSARFSRGELVEVIFDPDSPGDAIIDTFMERHFLPLMFVGMGSLFALVGCGFLWFMIRRRQIVARLKMRGLRVDAEVLNCTIDTSIRVNGRYPYRVHAQAKHPRTGMLASFRSDPIWIDLSQELEGRTVPVLVNARNAKHHYVDLSEWVHESERA
ncbi:MAG: DUF3592 domain-containing protein [Pseudomonadota bacterium]